MHAERREDVEVAYLGGHSRPSLVQKEVRTGGPLWHRKRHGYHFLSRRRSPEAVISSVDVGAPIPMGDQGASTPLALQRLAEEDPTFVVSTG